MSIDTPVQSAPVPPPTPPTRGASKAVAIVTIVAGAVIVIGTMAGAVIPTLAAAFTQNSDDSVGVAGVTELDLDVAATDLRIEYASGAREASLEVKGARTPWVFERDGDTLRVGTTHGMGWMSWFADGNGRAVLTLPTSMEGVDTELTATAGTVTVEGEFGELDVQMNAGDLTITGSADSLSSDLSAGSIDYDLVGVREAELTVSAGDADVRLAGTTPREVDITVTAGSLDLTLPDEEYDVTSNVTAGELDNQLRTMSNSANRVTVELTAGDVVLRPAAGR